MRQNKIITRFSILLGVLFFWGNSFAQISLSINKQTVKQIIPQIEKTSGYNVFYTDKLPNLDTRKDLLVSNAPLEATLKELFKGTKITFEIKPNKQVLLFQQANKPSGNRKQVPSKLLVEAESFDRKGGWVVDQQFMDLMGSPYLMAHGMGVPVEDASTTISFPEDGTYYVFVRTYNWTSPWYDGKGPGKYQVFSYYHQILPKGILSYPVLLFVAAAGFYMRYKLGSSYDFFLVGPMIYACVMLIKKIPGVIWVSKKAGRYITFVWLIHSFYVFQFGQKFIYSFGNPILIFIVLAVVSFASAAAVYWLFTGLSKGVKKIRCFHNRTV